MNGVALGRTTFLAASVLRGMNEGSLGDPNGMPSVPWTLKKSSSPPGVVGVSGGVGLVAVKDVCPRL
jgi:hypothetical protein